MTDYLADANAWMAKQKPPYFERTQFLNELDGLAGEAMSRGTVDSCLGAVLIYQQIAEEILKLLIRHSTFLVQLRLHPIEYPGPELPPRATFGQVVKLLRRSVVFPQRDAVVASADRLNTIRIRLVHKLVGEPSLSTLLPAAAEAKLAYDEMYPLFRGAEEWFRNHWLAVRAGHELISRGASAPLPVNRAPPSL